MEGFAKTIGDFMNKITNNGENAFGVAIGMMILLFIFGFIINKLLQIRKNRIATERKRIFDRYEQLQKGMSRKEVLQLFEGLKPSVNKKDRLEYKYEFRTKFNKEEGQKITLYFDCDTLVNIKLYDTNHEWYWQ